MTGDTECPHGLGEPAWCSTCQTGPTRPPKPMGHAWPARYPGRCFGKGCGEAIEEGQPIVLMTDGTYRHEECA